MLLVVQAVIAVQAESARRLKLQRRNAAEAQRRAQVGLGFQGGLSGDAPLARQQSGHGASRFPAQHPPQGTPTANELGAVIWTVLQRV
jgi:hypothetical protein